MKEINLFNVIKSLPFFNKVNECDIIKLSKVSFIKKYEKGKAIFLEGEKPIAFYFLLQGKVKVYKLSNNGKQQILRIVNENELFGEVPVFQNKNYFAYAEAMENSLLLGFWAKDFINLIKTIPDLAISFLSFLCVRLESLTNLVENISLKEVPQRLALYFLSLLKDNNCPKKCFLKISKAELASVLGTTPETLSRCLKKLKTNNIIDLDAKEIKILDLEKLKLISEGDIKI